MQMAAKWQWQGEGEEQEQEQEQEALNPCRPSNLGSSSNSNRQQQRFKRLAVAASPADSILHRFKRGRTRSQEDDVSVTNNHASFGVSSSAPAPAPAKLPPQQRVEEKQAFRIIPGPAGALQKDPSRNNISGCNPSRAHAVHNNVIGDADGDPDFLDSAWIEAVDYVRSNKSNYPGPNSSLKSIVDFSRRHGNIERVPQILGFISTCMPNKLGSVLITIKDPSGAINGTVHSNVFEQSEFGKNITVGSVILLRQVVVFSPTPFMHYLNITINNIAKVFRKGCCCPPEKQKGSSNNEEGKTFNEDLFIQGETSTVAKSKHVPNLTFERSHVQTDGDFSAADKPCKATNIASQTRSLLDQSDVFPNSRPNEVNIINRMHASSTHKTPGHVNLDESVHSGKKPLDGDLDKSYLREMAATTEVNPIRRDDRNENGNLSKLGMDATSLGVESYFNRNPLLPIITDWDEEVEILTADQPDMFG